MSAAGKNFEQNERGRQKFWAKRAPQAKILEKMGIAG